MFTPGKYLQGCNCWKETLLVTNTETQGTTEHAQNSADDIIATWAHRGGANQWNFCNNWKLTGLIQRLRVWKSEKTNLCLSGLLLAWYQCLHDKYLTVWLACVLLSISERCWAATPSPSATLHIAAEVLSLSPSVSPRPHVEPKTHTQTLCLNVSDSPCSP